MNAPSQCPKCGSRLSYPIFNGHANYTCNSFYTADGLFGQDVTCHKLSEITAPLLEQRDRTRKLLIKTAQRLEKIANASGFCDCKDCCEEICFKDLVLIGELREEAAE